MEAITAPLNFTDEDSDFRLKYYGGGGPTSPHVVMFSGGRSSGYMLALALHNGLLRAERGDVVIFNNTSAEHPATYDFVRLDEGTHRGARYSVFYSRILHLGALLEKG